ncbi:GtrA family protein [Methanopyrus sp. SNP6]|uniref:GtrA family protein n=1 Tax=Methanopyrus sp. SNP6 TaxID=1937005 RepID=UPI0011E589DD|nr:GtrA family protein [Methanopyrus sp. SNP6]
MKILFRVLERTPGVDDPERFLKFSLVGFSGVFVNLGLLWFLTEIAGVHYVMSNVIAVEVSIISNFVLNDLWTWRDRRDPGLLNFLKRLAAFNIICAGGLVINTTVLWTLTEILHIYYITSALFGIAAATLWNYWMNNRMTWGVLIERAHERRRGKNPG